MKAHDGPGRHVVLVGMMGVGKTTTAAALADHLGWSRCDSDEDLLAREGRPAAAIAHEDGVDRLHELEATLLAEALACEEPTVITAAASVVDSADSRQALATSATVVWLDAPTDVLRRRMGVAGHRRPLEPAALDRLVTRRRPLLADVADLHLDARRPTAALVADIVAALS